MHHIGTILMDFSKSNDFHYKLYVAYRISSDTGEPFRIIPTCLSVLKIGKIFRKYPEKLMPGKINIAFLSHHFMHVGTAIGVYANYFLCLDQFSRF